MTTTEHKHGDVLKCAAFYWSVSVYEVDDWIKGRPKTKLKLVWFHCAVASRVKSMDELGPECSTAEATVKNKIQQAVFFLFFVF